MTKRYTQADSQWLCDFISDSPKGADPKMVEAWCETRPGLLQELHDKKAIEVDVKGRIWLTTLGRSLAAGGRL